MTIASTHKEVQQRFTEASLRREALLSIIGCGVFADWLEEQGRVEDAHCWRWIYSHGREPVLRNKYNRYANTTPSSYRWAWFSFAIHEEPAFKRGEIQGEIPESSRLPYCLFRDVAHSDFNPGYKYFKTREYAVRELVGVLMSLWTELNPIVKS